MQDWLSIRRQLKTISSDQLKEQLRDSLQDSKGDPEPPRYTWKSFPSGWDKHKSWKMREDYRRHYRHEIRNLLKANQKQM